MLLYNGVFPASLPLRGGGARTMLGAINRTSLSVGVICNDLYSRPCFACRDRLFA